MPTPKGYRRTVQMTPEQYADAESRIGLPVTALAARLGVKPWSLWAYRSGWRSVPDATAVAIRALLNGHGAS